MKKPLFKSITKHKDKVIVAGYLQLHIYLFLMGTVISFLFLDDLNEEADFRALQLFIGIFVFFFMLHISLAVASKFTKRINGDVAYSWFQHDVTLGSLFWVPVGIGVAFGLAMLIGNLGLSQDDSALYSIYASGFVMMAIFVRTKAILIPIIIHGAFNSLVIFISSPAVAFNTAIPVPEIGLQLGTLSRLATESISQFFVVAPAEEMLKMGGITMWLLIGEGKFNPKSWKFYAGATVTVVWWGSLHLLNAL